MGQSALQKLREAKAAKAAKDTKKAPAAKKKADLKVVKSTPKKPAAKAKTQKETQKKAAPAQKAKKEQKSAPKKVAAKPAAKQPPVPTKQELKKMTEPNLNLLHDKLPGEIDGWGKMTKAQKIEVMIEGFHGESEEEAVETKKPGAKDTKKKGKASDEDQEEDSDDDTGTEAAEEDDAEDEDAEETEDSDDTEESDEVDAELDDDEADEKTSKKAVKEPLKRRKFDANDLIDKTVKELTNLSESEADEELQKLSGEIENPYTYFRLGGVLSVIKSGNFIGEHGSFKEKIEAEFDMKSRKADYLIEIYENLVASNVKWNQIKEIGWTKMKEISHLITPENAAEWVEKCSNMNCATLIKEVQMLDEEDGEELASKLSRVGKAESSVTVMTFKVHPDQKEIINEALTKAKEVLQTDVNTVALEGICQDFLSGNKKVKIREMSIKQFFQKVLADAKGKNEDIKVENAIQTLLEGSEFEEVFGCNIKNIDFKS